MSIRSKLFYLYVVFVALYAASFLIPRPIGTMHQYDLTATQYRLLSLTVLIPTAAIWYAAFYGYNKLRLYTSLISTSPDGRHVARLTKGIMFLAIGLPIAALSSSFFNIVIQHYPGFGAAAAILSGYVGLIFPLLGFVLVSQGARGLSDLAKQRPTYRAVNIMAAIFIAIGVFYCFAMLNAGNPAAHFHMPTWLIMLTIVGPYLYIWYLGIISAYEIHLYSRTVPGMLYRQAWNLMVSGVAAIIIMQIALQYITAVTANITQWRLARLLIIVYVLLAGISVGYILMAIGAKRLRKIEEV
jgi:uncharacterized membrane protein